MRTKTRAQKPIQIRVNNKKGMSLIEIVISVTLMTVIFMLLVKVYVPIRQEMESDIHKLKNYKQLVFVTYFLDKLYQLSAYTGVGHDSNGYYIEFAGRSRHGYQNADSGGTSANMPGNVEGNTAGAQANNLTIRAVCYVSEKYFGCSIPHADNLSRGSSGAIFDINEYIRGLTAENNFIPLLYLPDFGITDQLIMSQNSGGVPIKIQINKFKIQFGLYPLVNLI